MSSTHRIAQKDKDGWDQLCLVLEQVQSRSDKDFSKRVFMQVLLEIRSVKELLFLIRSEPIVESGEVIQRAQREFSSGQNIYLLHVDIFMEQILSLIGEEGRLLFLEKIGNALEEFRLDFKDRNDWADILVK